MRSTSTFHNRRSSSMKLRWRSAAFRYGFQPLLPGDPKPDGLVDLVDIVLGGERGPVALCCSHLTLPVARAQASTSSRFQTRPEANSASGLGNVASSRLSRSTYCRPPSSIFTIFF